MEEKQIIIDRETAKQFKILEYTEPIIETSFHRPIGFAS